MEIFEDKEIKYLFSDEFKKIFANFYFIDLREENRKQELKYLIDTSKNKCFVCYTMFPEHGIISIIQNGNIKLIDSSQVIHLFKKDKNILTDCLSEECKKILTNRDFENEKIKYFNKFSYQANETCYLNAALAFKVIMKELYNKTKELKEKEINEKLINKKLTDVINVLEEPIKSKDSAEVKITYRDKEIQKIVFKIFEESGKFYETLDTDIYLSEYSETKKIDSASTISKRSIKEKSGDKKIDEKKLILEKDLTEFLRKSDRLKECSSKLNVIKNKQTGEQTEEYDKPLQNTLKSSIVEQEEVDAKDFNREESSDEVKSKKNQRCR